MEEQIKGSDDGHVALIVGITGMVGVSLAEALKSPTAPGGPWVVYGASRRSLPPWFPPSIIDHHIPFDAIHKTDTFTKISPISHKVTHVFWVAIHVASTEEVNMKVNASMLDNVLGALTNHPNSALRHVCLQTGTKHYIGPIFDQNIGKNLMYVPQTPFVEDSPRLDFPNFYYSLEDLVASYSPAFTYSIHRPSIIVGASARSWYNMFLTFCVYAVICKHEGMPFRYPGTRFTWEHFCDISDARVLAEQHIWAAVVAGEEAKNQAFNCTNGDVFTWKSLWKEICEVFDVEFVAFDNKEFDWADAMKDKGKVWDLIVEKHGLCETKLDEIALFGGLQSVLGFKFQHVCSMNKSKDFGFFGYANSLNSVRFWVNRLRLMKIIP